MNENEFGVILEEIRDMFKALAEGQRLIEVRLDRVEERLDGLEVRVKALEDGLQQMRSDLSSFAHQAFVISRDREDRITALESKIG